MKLYISLLLFIFTLNVQAKFTFTPLETQTISHLNSILTKERDNFSIGTSRSYVLPHYSPAKYEVDLYKVTYDSTIPELVNKPTKASGLLAIPKILNASLLPIVSYQHGTVFGKHEVPSYAFLDPNNPVSFETRLMVAQFSGQGYIVIAADYFGMGDSTEPEGYTVKASEQQACLDLYDAAIQFLKQEKNISQTDLFLSGWSQGLVTTAFLEKLESRGISVKAASTASAPNDLFAATNGWIYHPRKIDAKWLNTLVGLSVFSYENYFSKPGLAKRVIKDSYYEALRKIYERDYNGPDELINVILPSIPANLKKLLKDEYSDPSYFADSEYGEIMASMQTYRRIFKAPLKMYYGTLDEVISIPIGKLASVYQESMGNKLTVTEAVKAGNHHGTFLTAVAGQKSWFDELKSH